MPRRAPHRGYFTKVEITCDAIGVCCAKRKNEEICGMDYKMPWDHLNVTKRDRNELDRGWPVRKLVPASKWDDMVTAWGESGFFGRSGGSPLLYIGTLVGVVALAAVAFTLTSKLKG